MSQVKAAVMVEVGKIEIQDFPRPKIADNALLMRVDQLGICGSDKHMYLGHTSLKFPVMPGHEVTGAVEEIGPLANEAMRVVGGPIKIGDKITVAPGSHGCGKCYFCLHTPHRPALCANRIIYGFSNCEEPPYLTGNAAQYTYIHNRSWVFKLPNEIPEKIRVLAEPAAVATRAVERCFAPGVPQVGAGYGVGKRVAVLGSGPIGLMVAAVFRHTGAGLIISTDIVESRLDMAKKMGADVTINVGETTLEERIERVQELTDGVGADIVIECAGVPSVLAEAIELVRRGGKVVEIGHYCDSGEVSVNPHVICRKDIDILAVWSYPQIQFATALEFLRQCNAPLEELVTHYLPLEKFEDGIKMLGTEGVYKIVVEPNKGWM